MTRASGFLVAAVLLAVLGSGCTTRDPLNPLDPENPDTRGQPEWLVATADNGAVDLAWDVPFFTDIDEVRVLDADTDSLLWTGDLGEGSLRETGLTNGVDRNYRLQLALTSGVLTDLPAAIATPGPEIPWVVDSGTGRVARLAPDGRRVREQLRAFDASAVVVDGPTGNVLVVEFFGRRVRLLDRVGAEIWSSVDIGRPVAALRVDGGWWVAETEFGAVMFLNDTGTRVYSDSSLTFPVDLAPAGMNSVWVADRFGAVGRFALGGGLVDSLGAVAPLAVAPAPAGGVWVADATARALYRLDADGDETLRLDWPGVAGLEPDPVVPGAVWVADRAARRVALVDVDGETLMELGGLRAPASISVPPPGDWIWVADPARSRLFRLSRDGETRIETIGIVSPVSVDVANPD